VVEIVVEKKAVLCLVKTVVEIVVKNIVSCVW
jgi:hypothetical protein